MAMMKEGYTRPLATMKSARPDEWRGLTSVNPGVITPIAFFPLLREDRIRASATVQVTSEETLHTIVNPVRVRVEAYLLPKTIFERFNGSLETLNRSYMDEPAPANGGTTPKWYLQHPALPANDKGHEIFDRLGVHWSATSKLNNDLVEGYNQLVNWMRKNVSPGLPMVDLANTTCLPAFWESWRFADIKPSFDAAQMEGAVDLALFSERLPVKGLLHSTSEDAAGVTVGAAHQSGSRAGVATDKKAYIDTASNSGVKPYVWVDLEGDAMVSLANLEMAKKTQAFAQMRDRYKSVPDEYLIDLLMQGINVPDADLRQPIKLAHAEAVIGQVERYATDGASLDTSVSNGTAMVSFTMNTPSINTGGYVMVVLSIVPEQLHERIEDAALRFVDGTKNDALTPDYQRDYLDPQKVEVVPNSFADIFHSDPDGVFGYAPMNYQWRRAFSRVGGKFKRPVPDAFVEDRQRIWSVEKTDPELSADFYLCPSPFPKTVFADQDSDPYEVITVIQASIVGNTVFGPGFEEDMGSYDAIIASIDQGRIDQTATNVADARGDVVEVEVLPASESEGE